MPRFKLEASLRTPTPSCLPTLMASFRHHGTTQTISYHFLRRRLHRLEKRNRYPAQLQDQLQQQRRPLFTECGLFTLIGINRPTPPLPQKPEFLDQVLSACARRVCPRGAQRGNWIPCPVR